MAFRTRVYARLSRPLLSPVHTMDVAGLPALRRRRARVQRSLLASPAVGRPSPDCHIDDVVAPVAGTDLRLRVYRPDDAGPGLPCVVAFHGGGFVLGTPEEVDWLCSAVSVRTRAVVVSPAYRLAPEHPYPAAVTDAWAATRWVHRHPDRFGIDRDRMAVMGESAGGTLAAVVALRARDAGWPGLRMQALLYPAVDLLETFESQRRYADGPVLTSAQLDGFSRLYLGGADGSERDASPLRADDLSGVAPALVLTAEHDPLRDHGARYADALAAAGVPTRHTRYRGAVHGFLALPGLVPAARQALVEIVHELGTALRPVRSS
ncbi:MAG: alpha/beta hydrolase [Nocardioidaceae bacterium]